MASKRSSQMEEMKPKFTFLASYSRINLGKNQRFCSQTGCQSTAAIGPDARKSFQEDISRSGNCS